LIEEAGVEKGTKIINAEAETARAENAGARMRNIGRHVMESEF